MSNLNLFYEETVDEGYRYIFRCTFPSCLSPFATTNDDPWNGTELIFGIFIEIDEI